ncbi:MAG TPA: tetratricopeptide repeat protein [Bryobacteraceae bacterium]|jgi:Tfp pilus assembly protein PilF
MPAPSRKQPLPATTLALVVAAVMLVLYGIDKFLAGQEASEMEQEARNHYVEGQRLLHAGNAHQAIVALARARTLERSNREYELALGTAQLEDHQLSAAADTLADVLDEDSNNGRANLLMARVEAAENKFKDADSYYHRAIYGDWPAGSTEPDSVRLELTSMLATRGDSDELLPELLLLQNSTVRDVATLKQIAALFLQADSASHAAETYQEIIQATPDDVEAHLGLARSEVLTGNYRAAENAVMKMARQHPYDATIQSQMRQVVRLASLDPTSRRLSTAEKNRRSMEIVEMVEDELTACGQPEPPSKPEASSQGPLTNEIAEALLDRAATLWEQRMKVCKQPPAPDDPLPLLMKKLQ